ncbi:ATP-dependent DNA ligase Cdc17, partial [Tieghemiomyces parasiticus]
MSNRKDLLASFFAPRKAKPAPAQDVSPAASGASPPEKIVAAAVKTQGRPSDKSGDHSDTSDGSAAPSRSRRRRSQKRHRREVSSSASETEGDDAVKPKSIISPVASPRQQSKTQQPAVKRESASDSEVKVATGLPVTTEDRPKPVKPSQPKSKKAKCTGSPVKAEQTIDAVSAIVASAQTLSATKPKAKKLTAAAAAKKAAEAAAMTAPPEVVQRFSELVQTEVPYAALCYMFEQVEATTKRLLIIDILTHFFRRVITHAPQDLVQCVYLCINRLCPEYEGLELGVGESLLFKAVAEATGRPVAKVKADVTLRGDIGQVAMLSRSTQRTMLGVQRGLKVATVFKTLRQIATTSGQSSMKLKVDKIKGLLASCQGAEAKYLMRSLEGKLRIGLAEQTVLTALAYAFVLHHHHSTNGDLDLKVEASGSDSDADPDETISRRVTGVVTPETFQSAAETVKAVYNELPSYDVLVPALLKRGVDHVHEACKLTAGIPVKPMLAHPTKAISEVLDRFEGHTFTCEYKYDGERAQLHRLPDGRTMVFSRNSEDMTAKYPDLVVKLNHAVAAANQQNTAATEGIAPTTSFILDAEAVAWDSAERKILPFQVLSTRKRKDVREEDITVKVCIFAFDLIYLNGRSLLRESLAERRRLLYQHFAHVDGEFSFAKALVATDVEAIQTFLDESIRDNCEGLMVKTLDGDEATYEPSRRSRNWLKVKKDYINGIGDSLDLVVVGAYPGRGKRTGVYGGFLLACYNPDSEQYETICKIGTGFSEADLESHRDQLKQHIISKPRSYYDYAESAEPEVWFDPKVVWEVKAADLSISPVYRAGVGKVDSNKGISLRFPRFIRIRDDKSPEDATTSDQVAQMYRDQKLHTAAGER